MIGRIVTTLLLFAVFVIPAALLVRGVRPGIAADDPAANTPAERPYGIPSRAPWTTSRITGSPEPPHPYRIERAFPKLVFKNPLLITNAPGIERLFVGEHAGKLYSFPNDQTCAKADLFLDLTTELKSWDRSKVKGIDAVYGLAFHPKFAQNHLCYVCYVLNSKKDGEQLPDGSRVSRFKVTQTDPPRIDPASEKILLTWLGGGHNGGDMHFGPDGYLYISTGDGTNPNPPDLFNTGQDISDLLSSVLRIDVDHEENGRPYVIPADNPFIKTPGARPEVWAYGFRNPWRMSFDRATGDLWVGDVGWELWEMVYRVRRGGNYGWSVMEGRQPVRPDSKRGPTPILPPTLDFPHSEAASVTGGYVYRGKRLKELVGAYLCGDWVTRKLWGTRFDKDDHILWHQELAQGPHRIVAFGEDNAGEVYFLDYDDNGTILQLVPNEAAKQKQADFPRKLSETGLFTSVPRQTPSPGVVPFSINAEQWNDGATAERFLALPGESTARIYDRPITIPGGFFSGAVFFPKDGVLARTVSLELEQGNPKSRRRLETQILHFDGLAWRGYTYGWNDEQTDAVLMAATGEDRNFTVVDAGAPEGKRRQTWHYPSRAECMQCHNPWTGHTIAFTLPQLNREHQYGGVRDNQLRAFQHAGMLTLLHENRGKDTPASGPFPRLTDAGDERADLTLRARSYLQVNCAHCHQLGAGGTADIELRYDVPLDKMKTVDVRPVQGTFDIAGAQIVAPGDPYRSVLYFRIAKLGRGRMPHIGSELVDERGARLIREWIQQLPSGKDERNLMDRLRAVGESSKPAERIDAINQLLSTTAGALRLADALGDGSVPDSLRTQVVDAAMARSEVQVRDLFERFLPDSKRVKRLGSVIKADQLLALKGDVARGRELFVKSAGLQCAACHRVAGSGGSLGPDLTEIAKKYTRAQLLESMLEPSKSIDPKYVAYLVVTTEGQSHTGILVERTEREVVLRVLGDKEVRIEAAKVESMTAQKVSLMPEGLLRDLTAEQAADLLEFLASLK